MSGPGSGNPEGTSGSGVSDGVGGRMTSGSGIGIGTFGWGDGMGFLLEWSFGKCVWTAFVPGRLAQPGHQQRSATPERRDKAQPRRKDPETPVAWRMTAQLRQTDTGAELLHRHSISRGHLSP